MIAEEPGCNVSEIDLSRNDVRQMLDNAESAKPLKTVVGLNLLDNLNFESVKKTVTDVRCLFPYLRSL